MAELCVWIVEGDAFGTSTAYRLALRDYKDVRVLDRYGPPSPDPAATDLNRTVRYDSSEITYAGMVTQEMEIWKSPSGLLAELFKKTVWIVAGGALTKDWVSKACNVAQGTNAGIPSFLQPEDFRRLWLAMKEHFEDWTGFWSPEAGWDFLRTLFSPCPGRLGI